MSADEWIYKYIFFTEIFRIAVVKKHFEQHRIKHKCHRILIEYRVDKRKCMYKTIGFL